MRLAILDDYQNVALGLADWPRLSGHCSVTAFDRPFRDVDDAAEALEPFDILCTMRERTALPGELLERLPHLKLITITGGQHRTLDLAAATRLGIAVSGTTRRGTGHHATPELAWGLILSLARHIPLEATRMRAGGWQETLGTVLSGKTLGLLGLGRLGSRMVPIGRAFGMEVIAWSPNLTDARAVEVGATRVERDDLFARSDVLSLHVVLSERSRGMVGRRELGLMKPGAFLINTARGPIVDEEALIDALAAGRIATGLDVFATEPLPDDHPLRRMPNVILTPHLGYTVKELFQVFYEDTVENVEAFLEGAPIRLVDPTVVPRVRGTPAR